MVLRAKLAHGEIGGSIMRARLALVRKMSAAALSLLCIALTMCSSGDDQSRTKDGGKANSGGSEKASAGGSASGGANAGGGATPQATKTQMRVILLVEAVELLALQVLPATQA